MSEYRIYEFKAPNNGGPDWKNVVTSVLPTLGIILVIWILTMGVGAAISGFGSKLLVMPIFVVSLVLHELSHAYMANFLGDPTPRLTGRLSLNPLKHLDLWGTLLFIFCGFGWAKPVQVDANYFKKPDRAMVSVALAGPLCNFLLALVGALLFKSFYQYLNNKDYLTIFFQFCFAISYINVMLAVFNLLPIPPLDGSRLVHYLLPKQYKAKYYQIAREYSIIIFIAVFLWAGKAIVPITQQLTKHIWDFIV
ncbi:MAG: site-2 protease family protein [Candidatus Riflebacteria bacterium]|nr:site-2 protease family protein [Candidatus Riflebacteria bacterium]